jgi:8-oxo-dGTP pyrophosphatase MutT (NUDIX family)
MIKVKEARALRSTVLKPVWTCMQYKCQYWDGDNIWYHGGYIAISKFADEPYIDFRDIPNFGDKHICLTDIYSKEELQNMTWVDVICDYSGFDKKEIIEGSYDNIREQALTEKTENDTNNRVGVLIFNGNGKFLIEHAPNKPHDKNSWDLPKGHISFDDPSLEYAVKRECFEETGIFLDKVEELGTFLYVNPYDIGDLTMFKASVNDTQFADCDEEELLSSLVCSTFFEEDGKKLPEANEYKFISPAELKDYLYDSLVDYFTYNFEF